MNGRSWCLGVAMLSCSAAGWGAPGDTELVSINTDAPLLVGLPNGPSDAASISADGRYVAFASEAANFVDDDTNGVSDIFVYDRIERTTTRVSVDSAGGEANGTSWERPAISADGRFVVFSSEATNLVPEPLDGINPQVFMHDRRYGTTRLVSVSSGGAPAAQGAYSPSISAHARYIAFLSGAANLVPNDTNNLTDVFVRDTVLGSTERINVSSTGAQATGNAFRVHTRAPAISAWGRYVAFESNAANLVEGDTNGQPDVFVRDRELGTTTRASLTDAGGQMDGASDAPAISADGRYVTFTSTMANPWLNNELFLRDRVSGTTERITELTAPEQYVHSPSMSIDGRYLVYGISDQVYRYDHTTGATATVSFDTAGGAANGPSSLPSISRSGRYVAFTSAASDLVPQDAGFQSDIFVTDMATASISRIEPEPIGLYSGNAASASGPRRALSRDGRFAVFSSLASTLVPGDTNGVQDVFVRDLETGQTTRVSVDSTGAEANGASGGALITPDGRFIAFSSVADNLVPGDDDGHADIFVHDRISGETVIVDASGAAGTGAFDISADGRYVVFMATSAIASLPLLHDRETGETLELGADLCCGGQRFPSISDDGRRVAFTMLGQSLRPEVLVYDRDTERYRRIPLGHASGSISPDGRFVVLTSETADGQVYLHNLETGLNTLVSVDSGGNRGNGDSSSAAVSADSRFVTFSSDATNLVSGDTNGIRDVFVHDRYSGATMRVSVDSEGVQAEVADLPLPPFQRPRGSYVSSISDDGSRVLFSSDAVNLTPTTPDLNNQSDVFVHELEPLPATPPFVQDAEGLVSVEAEHYYIGLQAVAHWRPLPADGFLDPWMVVTRPAASGGEALQADPYWKQTLSKPVAPVNGYSIKFTRTGRHYVWVRGRAPSPQEDALGIGLDRGPMLPYWVPKTGGWAWHRGWSAIDVTSPGEHRLWLYRRERNVEIDKIVITPDRRFVPDGLGPAESDRAGANASPILSAIGNQTLAVHQSLDISLSASDPDADPLVFSAPELPPFARLADHGDGSATLTLTPGPGDIGAHTLRVFVSDLGRPPVSDEETFQVEVVGAAFQQAAGGLLTVEAEHFDESLPGSDAGRWAVLPDPGASQTGAITSGPWRPSSSFESPRTEYHVNFNRSGRHYVWFRARAFLPSWDAFYVGLDDRSPLPRFVNPRNGQWIWFRGWQQFDVPDPGIHTVRIYRWEREVAIDKIVITPWPGFTPTGTGPPESERR